MVLGLVGTVGVSVSAVAQERERPSDWWAQAALQYFESVQVTDFDALLRQLRRPAPPASVRAWVIKNLPGEGELTPTAQEAAKLRALLPVLAFHGRERDMELRLITAGGLAFAGLHARTVLLISRETLRLIDTNELLAIGAHELGHDYLWDDYAEAEREGNTRRLQELELRCDGFAVITMASLRVHPERLVSAAIKLARYNERMFGKPIDPRYVPLDQRIRFIRSVAKLTGARGGR
jgi:Zn-dependent protease with chaperone function